MFFAVSGFLITTMTLRRWGQLSRVSLHGFYVMRFARIVPLLAILLGVLSILHAAQVRYFIVPEKTGGLARALVAALTFHINVLEARRGYLPGSWDILWSLSVEEIFYLAFPLVARFLGRSKLFLLLLVVLVAAGPFARTVLAHDNEVWREYSYLGGMDAIALGCLTALLVSKHGFSKLSLRLLGAGGLALMIIVLAFSVRMRGLGLVRTGLDMTVLAVGTCMVIAAATQTNWRSPRLFAPLLGLGRRSYEIYLTHMFLVFGLFQLFLLAGKPLKAVPVLFILVILLSGLLGEAVARFYSEPMNQSIRRRWRDRSSPMASQAVGPQPTAV